MSDKALLQYLGKFIKDHRMQQNRSQEQLATDAGVSRSTVSLLERGQPVALTSFLQILRVLNQLHVLTAFKVEPQYSPMQLAKLEQQKRQRAGRKKPDNNSALPVDW